MSGECYIDENDLPDEEIFSMWKEAEPVELVSGPEGRDSDYGWSCLGASEASAGRITLTIDTSRSEQNCQRISDSMEETGSQMPEHADDSNRMVAVE